MSTPKTVIIITGPTASGKTSLAIEAALHFKTEIISADSRQCYKELNIGVARPSEKELAQVAHHFIASHSIHNEITAAFFEKYALEKTSKLFQEHDHVVMVGGTGLYIKAFCEGLDEIPAVADDIRAGIIDNYGKKGIGWLSAELTKKDPLYAGSGEMQNPQRMMRALEVVEATGQSIVSFRKGKKAERDFNIIKVAIDLPKEELHARIHKRTDMMMEQGLLEEVKALLPYRHLNALQTVGYREMFEYVDGGIGLDRAVEQVKINTRQYAKRQLTWFRRDKEMKWLSEPSLEKLLLEISN